MRKLLFFYAPWCSPCKFYSKEIISKVEAELPSHVVRINAENRPDLAQKHDIDRLPSIVMLDGENVILRSTGGYMPEKLIKKLREDDAD